MQTVGDLDKAFKLYVDKADSQGTADFLVGERQRFLNDAQRQIARRICTKKSDDQDDVDLRRTLSVYAKLPVTAGEDGAGQAELPADYLAFGRCRVQLRAPYEQYVLTPTVISEDELSDALSDPFNSPTIGEPLVCFLYNAIQVYPGAASERLLLSYYRHAPDLDLSTPAQVPALPETLLSELVQLAVQLALESVADPRFQTQAAITSRTQNP
jgi:hypothetical protein